MLDPVTRRAVLVGIKQADCDARLVMIVVTCTTNSLWATSSGNQAPETALATVPGLQPRRVGFVRLEGAEIRDG
jgi:hypothetical protein